MVQLFSAGGKKVAVGLIVMVVTFSFALIAVADALLLIKVDDDSSRSHSVLLRLGSSIVSAIGSDTRTSPTGVSIGFREQVNPNERERDVQCREFSFLSPTVRGAAREVATAGINETIRSSGNQQQARN